MITKILIGFIFIALLETLNGIFRVRFLIKRFGKKNAKIVSFVLGATLIYLLNSLLLPWIDPSGLIQAFSVGLTWAALMVAYDVYVGRKLFKLSWDLILEDFNVLKGNLLSLGILFILFLPLFIYFFKL